MDWHWDMASNNAFHGSLGAKTDHTFGTSLGKNINPFDLMSYMKIILVNRRSLHIRGSQGILETGEISAAVFSLNQSSRRGDGVCRILVSLLGLALHGR